MGLSPNRSFLLQEENKITLTKCLLLQLGGETVVQILQISCILTHACLGCVKMVN